MSYKKIRDWSNANQGLLALFALIITLLSNVPMEELDLNLARSYLGVLADIFNLRIQIPIYLLALLGLVVLLYILKLKKRYTPKGIGKNFLVGTWKNEWTINGHTDSETFSITEDLHYIIGNEHVFTIVNFKYDPLVNEISFIKKGVRTDDNRKLLNTLKIINNDTLSGNEEAYLVKYTKLSG